MDIDELPTQCGYRGHVIMRVPQKDKLTILLAEGGMEEFTHVITLHAIRRDIFT